MTDRLAARQLVARGLDALDFDKRVVLVMHDMEGISAPEIAAELHIPLNTVYSRVRLARDGFKKALLDRVGCDADIDGRCAVSEMEPLDPELASLFTAERAAHPPEPLARDEVLARVERAVKLQLLAEATAHGRRATSIVAKAKLAAGAAALFGAGLVLGRETAPVAQPKPVSALSASASVAAPAPSTAAGTDAAPPAVDEPSSPPAPTLAPTSAARASATATAPSSGPSPSDLFKEQELVDTARVALARGRPADAFEATSAHAKRFPQGRLVEEREALAIQALAMSGQGDAARARAAAFRRRYPSSIFLRAIDDVTARP